MYIDYDKFVYTNDLNKKAKVFYKYKLLDIRENNEWVFVEQYYYNLSNRWILLGKFDISIKELIVNVVDLKTHFVTNPSKIKALFGGCFCLDNVFMKYLSKNYGSMERIVYFEHNLTEKLKLKLSKIALLGSLITDKFTNVTIYVLDKEIYVISDKPIVCYNAQFLFYNVKFFTVVLDNIDFSECSDFQSMYKSCRMKRVFIDFNKFNNIKNINNMFFSSDIIWLTIKNLDIDKFTKDKIEGLFYLLDTEYLKLDNIRVNSDYSKDMLYNLLYFRAKIGEFMTNSEIVKDIFNKIPKDMKI